MIVEIPLRLTFPLASVSTHEAAARFALDNPDAVLMLVHGAVGTRPHAWVEIMVGIPVDGPASYPIERPVIAQQPFVVDVTLPPSTRVMPRSVYYQILDIAADPARYDRASIVDLVARNGSWGPWASCV